MSNYCEDCGTSPCTGGCAEKHGVSASFSNELLCCVCKETLTDEESNLGYCEDCRNGHDDLESLIQNSLET